jgi:hypothetical protein
LRVYAPGHVSHLERVDLETARELRIQLEDGLRITGRVLDAGGAPLTAFAVRAPRLRGLQPVMRDAHAGRSRQELLDQLAAATQVPRAPRRWAT